MRRSLVSTELRLLRVEMMVPRLKQQEPEDAATLFDTFPPAGMRAEGDLRQKYSRDRKSRKSASSNTQDIVRVFLRKIFPLLCFAFGVIVGTVVTFLLL